MTDKAPKKKAKKPKRPERDRTPSNIILRPPKLLPMRKIKDGEKQ
jgi:hypothetical protein